jgi:hypothetical protein
MAIKDLISRGSPEKGKCSEYSSSRDGLEADICRFGWVNASYVYGLTFLPMHMKRALGTLTPYETFKKATEIKLSAIDDVDTIHEGSDESRQDSGEDAPSEQPVSSSTESLST